MHAGRGVYCWQCLSTCRNVSGVLTRSCCRRQWPVQEQRQRRSPSGAHIQVDGPKHVHIVIWSCRAGLPAGMTSVPMTAGMTAVASISCAVALANVKVQKSMVAVAFQGGQVQLVSNHCVGLHTAQRAHHTDSLAIPCSCRTQCSCS